MLTLSFKTFLHPTKPVMPSSVPHRAMLTPEPVDASMRNPRSFADPELERKRVEAIARLGERYLAHPTHSPKKGEHGELPPEKQAELRGWIAAAEHLEQIADGIGGSAGAAYRDSAARLRSRARDLFAHGVGA
jgi:hypothetical protein